MTRFRTFICASVAVMLAASAAAATPLALRVVDASVVNEPAVGGAAINVKLAPDSAKSFEDFTAAHVGDTLDVMVDGTIVMAPKLIDPIHGGTLQISGAFDRAEWLSSQGQLKSGQSRLEIDVAPR